MPSEKDVLDRLVGAAMGVEPITSVGAEREIAALRDMIASETDPEMLRRMRARLATVERLGDEADPTRDTELDP